MANGPLAMPPSDPNELMQRQMQARQMGLLTAPGQPTFGPPQGGASFPGGSMPELYGIMAQGADKPSQIGMDYVAAMQRQQQLDQANSPLEQFLRLYGSVNPFDFTPESLQKFHDNFKQTGDPYSGFKFLERKDELSSTEQKQLYESIEGASKAQVQYGRMGDYARRFDALARQGNPGGVRASLGEWLKKIGGKEDDITLLRTEFDQLRISEVVGNLPPGVASDKDVELVLKGWPPATASPAHVAAFLRGMQKIKAMEYRYNSAKANHLSQFESLKHFLPAWQSQMEVAAQQALAAAGGYWNPGADMSPEEAAEMYYAGIIPSRATGSAAPAGSMSTGGKTLNDMDADTLLRITDEM